MGHDVLAVMQMTWTRDAYGYRLSRRQTDRYEKGKLAIRTTIAETTTVSVGAGNWRSGDGFGRCSCLSGVGRSLRRRSCDMFSGGTLAPAELLAIQARLALEAACFTTIAAYDECVARG